MYSICHSLIHSKGGRGVWSYSIGQYHPEKGPKAWKVVKFAEAINSSNELYREDGQWEIGLWVMVRMLTLRLRHGHVPTLLMRLSRASHCSGFVVKNVLYFVPICLAERDNQDRHIPFAARIGQEKVAPPGDLRGASHATTAEHAGSDGSIMLS